MFGPKLTVQLETMVLLIDGIKKHIRKRMTEKAQCCTIYSYALHYHFFTKLCFPNHHHFFNIKENRIHIYIYKDLVAKHKNIKVFIIYYSYDMPFAEKKPSKETKKQTKQTDKIGVYNNFVLSRNRTE